MKINLEDIPKHKKRGLSPIVLVLTLAIAIAACSFSLPKSWEEEVLLHDGSKIIATRHISYKGRYEIGQDAPVGESTISFKLPISNETIFWTSEYAKDLGRTNFILLALHVLNGTPYIVASPNGCTPYNKFGRPNPPYVFFKYDDKKWHRIQLSEFPVVFKTLNLYISLGRQDVKALVKYSPVSSKYIQEQNGKLTQYPEFQTILRDPIKHAEFKKGNDLTGCKVLVRIEDGWATPNHVETMRKSKILREKELERRRKTVEGSDKK